MKENKSIFNEMDQAKLKLSIEHYIKYFIGKRNCEITKRDAFTVIALAVREFAMDKMYETIARYNEKSTKHVYYLSIEYRSNLILSVKGKQKHLEGNRRIRILIFLSLMPVLLICRKNMRL